MSKFYYIHKGNCYMVYYTSNWIGWNYGLEENFDICVGYGSDLIEKIRIVINYPKL